MIIYVYLVKGVFFNWYNLILVDNFLMWFYKFCYIILRWDYNKDILVWKVVEISSVIDKVFFMLFCFM